MGGPINIFSFICLSHMIKVTIKIENICEWLINLSNFIDKMSQLKFM